MISFRKSHATTTTTTTTKNNAHNSSSSKEDSSLWEAFSSLTISNNENKSIRDKHMHIQNDDEVLIKMGSELITSIIHDKTISSNLPYTNIHATKEEETKTNVQMKSPSRILLGLPKSIMSHTYSKVTSILARYDLMEQDIQVNSDYNVEDDEDDAFGTCNNEDIYTFTDYDDADVSKHSSAHKSAAPPPILSEMDTIWSIELIIDCWRIITTHINYTLESQEEKHGFNTTNANDGILLNRRGNDTKSFLHFCRQVLEAGHSTTTSNMNTPLGVKKILSNLTTGFGLELLMMILIQTNSASLSPDGTVLCLFQPQTFTTTTTNTDNQQSHHSPLHEADIAEFKLVIAIESLERRIDTLTTKAQDYANQALSAKQSNQTKVAVLHMKRRMILLSEIETSSSSLLNLETTLHSVQRARNDAQVLKTFEVVNDALKLVRSELDGVGDVEEITDTLRSNIEGVEEVHEGIFGRNLSGNGWNETSDGDMKELEAELELLAGEENVDNTLPVDTKPSACSEGNITVEGNSEPIIRECSTSTKKELKGTDIPVQDNGAIINPSTDGFVDKSARKHCKIVQ